MDGLCSMAKTFRIRGVTYWHCQCKVIESLWQSSTLHSMNAILNFRRMGDGWFTTPTNPVDSKSTSYRFLQAAVNGRFLQMEVSRHAGVAMGKSCSFSHPTGR